MSHQIGTMGQHCGLAFIYTNNHSLVKGLVFVLYIVVVL